MCNVTLCGGEQVNDILDGLVGFVIGALEFAFGRVSWVRSVVKAAIGERPAERLWKKRNRRATSTPLGVSR